MNILCIPILVFLAIICWQFAWVNKPKKRRYPEAELDVLCRCGKGINMVVSQPMYIKHCWGCNRDIRVVLSTTGGVQVHIKEPMTFHFDDHADRMTLKEYRIVSVKR